MKNEKITIGHGSGGKLTQELIENIFLVESELYREHVGKTHEAFGKID